jgi:hypothetical protein
MSPLLIKISKDFATIWTTIDPIGNVAIFAVGENGFSPHFLRFRRLLTCSGAFYSRAGAPSRNGKGEGTRSKAKGVS